MTPTHPRTATYQRGLGDTPSEAATSPQDAPRAKGMLSYRPRAREAPRNRLQPVNLTPSQGSRLSPQERP